MSEKVVIDFNSRKTDRCKTFTFLRIEEKSKPERERISSNKPDNRSLIRDEHFLCIQKSHKLEYYCTKMALELVGTTRWILPP